MIAVDLGGGRRLCREEAGSIISRGKYAERELLCVQPTNPDLHEATWMNTAFRVLGYV